MATNVRVPWTTVERYVSELFEEGGPVSRDDIILHALTRQAPDLVIEVLGHLNEAQQYYSLQQVNAPLRTQGYLTDYRR